jgi:hypothetical protein
MTKSNSTNRHAIPFLIPTSWTPAQALAVYDLLDDLRDTIWRRYDQQIAEEYCNQVTQLEPEHEEFDPDDPPF